MDWGIILSWLGLIFNLAANEHSNCLQEELLVAIELFESDVFTHTLWFNLGFLKTLISEQSHSSYWVICAQVLDVVVKLMVLSA